MMGGRDQALLLLAPLAAAQHSQGEHRDAEDRGGSEAELDAEQAFAAPVDVAQVEEEGRLVEGEAEADPHRHRQPLLELVVVGQQGGGSRAEGDEDAGGEVVDVASTDVDVAEGPAPVPDRPGGEAHEGEGAEEAGEEVEEDG